MLGLAIGRQWCILSRKHCVFRPFTGNCRSLRLFGNSLKTKQQRSTDKIAEHHSILSDFEKSWFKRLEQAGFKRSKRFYGSVVTLSIASCVGAYLYLFPHKLRQQVVEEVSTVASQSLEDEKIVEKAGQLSKDVLSDILNDSNTKTVASDFVKDIIVSEPIKEAAIGTILGLLNDPRVLDLLRDRLSTIILGILQNDSTRQIVLSQVNTMLEHESIRMSLKRLLDDLMNTREVQLMMANFFRDILASDIVKDQGKVLGQQVTSDVISDEEIQKMAGNALWAAFTQAVTPNVFKNKRNVEKNLENKIPDENQGKATGSKNNSGVDVVEEELDIDHYD